jgi:hypothetical protein
MSLVSKVAPITNERLENRHRDLGRYKTIDEAAAVLRNGPRWLTDWLRSHPVDRHGEPFYHLAGRTKLFTDRDIDRIRENLPCPSPFARRDRRNRQAKPGLARGGAEGGRLRQSLCRKSIWGQD